MVILSWCPIRHSVKFERGLMKALIIKEFRELVRDRRTLAMLILLPVVLLLVFGYAANFSVDQIRVAVIGEGAEDLIERLGEYEATEENLDFVDASGTAENILRNQEAEMVFVAAEKSSDDVPLMELMETYIDGSSLFSAQSAKRIVTQLAVEDAQKTAADIASQVQQVREDAELAQRSMQEFFTDLAAFGSDLNSALAAGQQPPSFPTLPEGMDMPKIPQVSTPDIDPDAIITVLFNPDLKTSWIMVPGLIGLVLTIIGVLITSIGLVRERENGTMEQLAVMPLRPSAIIMGKIIPYFVLALVDMALITALGVGIFNVPFIGSVGLFCLLCLIFLFVVLGLGVMISSVSENSGQAIQLAIMMAVPQILLSGLIFPLGSMALWVRVIGYVLPLTWFIDGARGIMLRDAGIETVGLPLLILFAEAIVIFTVATLRMRFSLTHGGNHR